ncbi:hypothetical protein [Saccharopolyspora phatthalungensis]|uniref:GNAT family N-acetyltransferase n=1 Tax=Saccharopolyspora phatthalungensis TaxID=664693 RepID=A0A840QFH6_9PSEU|nr:hypothetical protein [Saccharopolyspora phatthalungensis]MBB5158821.1 hypothetical protein [Saccharopolyspora phatthalungensis]
MSDVEFHRVPTAEVYREVFARYEYGDEHVRLFKDRFAIQHQRPGVGLIVATGSDGSMAGFGFGLTMPSATTWWTGLTTDVEPEVTEESPGRTFMLIELHGRR